MKNKFIISMMIIITLIAGSIIGYRYFHKDSHTPVIMTTEQLKSPSVIQDNLKVSPEKAVKVYRSIDKLQNARPHETYKAHNIKDVEMIEKYNKADKTIIATKPKKEDDTETAKVKAGEGNPPMDVNVYRINFEKPFKIKAGITYMHDEMYKSLAVEKNNIEATMHFKGSHIEGGSVMYTIYKK